MKDFQNSVWKEKGWNYLLNALKWVDAHTLLIPLFHMLQSTGKKVETIGVTSVNWAAHE